MLRIDKYFWHRNVGFFFFFGVLSLLYLSVKEDVSYVAQDQRFWAAPSIRQILSVWSGNLLLACGEAVMSKAPTEGTGQVCMGLQLEKHCEKKPILKQWEVIKTC